MATEKQRLEDSVQERRTPRARKYVLKVGRLPASEVLAPAAPESRALLGAASRVFSTGSGKSGSLPLLAVAPQATGLVQPQTTGVTSQRLLRASRDVQKRLQAAVASGQLEWGGGQFRPEEPTLTLPEGESLVETLLADRGR